MLPNIEVLSANNLKLYWGGDENQGDIVCSANMEENKGVTGYHEKNCSYESLFKMFFLHSSTVAIIKNKFWFLPLIIIFSTGSSFFELR